MYNVLLILILKIYFKEWQNIKFAFNNPIILLNDWIYINLTNELKSMSTEFSSYFQSKCLDNSPMKLLVISVISGNKFIEEISYFNSSIFSLFGYNIEFFNC